MTVGAKLHQTLVSCESAVANLKSFSLDTENKQAKALYAGLAQTLDQQIVNPLRNQVSQIESQEPQYQVYNQAQQSAQQQAGRQSGSQAQQVQGKANQNMK